MEDVPMEPSSARPGAEERKRNDPESVSFKFALSFMRFQSVTEAFLDECLDGELDETERGALREAREYLRRCTDWLDELLASNA